jgi:arsenate reductase (thioredoxin)
LRVGLQYKVKTHFAVGTHMPTLGELSIMKKGVLFVCIGNSCRSIMAEALTRRYWGDAVRAFSAGTHPLAHITEYTLDALRERDLLTNGLYSKGFSEIAFNEIQLIVSLTGDSLRHLIPPSFSGKMVRWHIVDPYGFGLSVFRQTLVTIEWMIKKKLPDWLELNVDELIRAQLSGEDRSTSELEPSS